MAQKLQDCRVALLVAPRGSEHVEFAEPKRAVEEAGAHVTVLGLSDGPARTVNGDLDPAEEVPVDRSIADASAEDFDALIVPGGTVGADKLRGEPRVARFVEAFFSHGKPVAAICHGPWTLVEADVVRGRRLTSYPSLQTDVRNAGGEWVDEEVVVDDGLVTSRRPDDLPAFCDTLVEVFAGSRIQEAHRA